MPTDYRTEAPPILRDFLAYHETIKAHSQRTVDEYYLDLRNFFRYLKQSRDASLAGKPLDEIDISDVDLDFVASVTLTDIYSYMTYLSRDRVLHAEQPQPGIRPQRRLPGPEDRLHPLVLQLPYQQDPPSFVKILSKIWIRRS